MWTVLKWTEWKRQNQVRGRPQRDAHEDRIARLEQEKRQLEQKLTKARFVVEVQAKTARALGDDLRERPTRARVEVVTDAAVAELAPVIGVRAACDAVGVAQASYYRRHRASPAPRRPTPTAYRDRPQPRALSDQERFHFAGPFPVSCGQWEHIRAVMDAMARD